MKHRAANVSVAATLVAVGIVVWASLASAPNSSAIPAFSRKYQTSCTTCHSNYPELNDFGETFKKNGFKFPKDDEVFVKEPPVLLGAKGAERSLPWCCLPGRDSRKHPRRVPLFRQLHLQQQTTHQPRVPAADRPVCSQHLYHHRRRQLRSHAFVLVDNDISAGGSNAAAGLGDGYLKVNDIGATSVCRRTPSICEWVSSSWTCRLRRRAASTSRRMTYTARQASLP